MNAVHQTLQEPTAAAELDLMPYINALIDARWLLLGGTLAAALLVALWAYSKPYQYQSIARVSIVDIEDPGGVSRTIVALLRC